MTTDTLRTAVEDALGAQYEIGRLLGRGGMGAVYLARERLLGREVAIKVLPGENHTASLARERFLREARVAAMLTHPNIVPLHSLGEANGMLFFVMGYVDGETLQARLERVGRLTPEEASRILGEVADALAYAHRRGVVHRDLKPDNILMDRATGAAMLADFGVAKRQASGYSLTEAGMVLGTPHYMSPEQASGDTNLDGRSDLYALGVIGFRMLTGHLPFEGATLRELLTAQISREAPRIAALEPTLPTQLVQAVQRCLEKDPARRWPDGTGLRDALTESEDDPTRKSERADSMLFIAAGTTAIAWPAAFWAYGTGGGPFPWWLYAIMPCAHLLDAGLYRLLGVPFRTQARRALRPPRFWSLAWPSAWRRPGDVWNRLPPWGRRARTVMTFGFLGCVLGLEMIAVLGIGLIPKVPAPFFKTLATVMLWTFSFGLVASTAGFIMGLVSGKRHGTSLEDAWELLRTSTVDPVWKKHRMARFLSLSSAAGEEYQAPQPLAESIEEMVNSLPSHLHEIGTEVARIAAELRQGIAAVDRELAELIASTDPQEKSRLDQRIAALGEGAENSPVRSLLLQQRALHLELDQRRNDLVVRRDRLSELGRTLVLQVRLLVAEVNQSTRDDGDVTVRIRALCHDVSAQVAGERGVKALLSS